MDRDLPEPQPFDPSRTDAPPLPSHASGSAQVVALVAPPGVRDADWAAATAAALASAWARRGRRILLADVSLTRPGLHRALGVDNDEGVSDAFLYGSSLQRVARPAPEGGFLFVPAGTVTGRPEAVAASGRWASVVDGCARARATLVVLVPEDLPGGEALVERASDVFLLGVDPASGEDGWVGGASDRVRAMLVPNGAGTAAPSADPDPTSTTAADEASVAAPAPAAPADVEEETPSPAPVPLLEEAPSGAGPAPDGAPPLARGVFADDPGDDVLDVPLDIVPDPGVAGDAPEPLPPASADAGFEVDADLVPPAADPEPPLPDFGLPQTDPEAAPEGPADVDLDLGAFTLDAALEEEASPSPDASMTAGSAVETPDDDSGPTTFEPLDLGSDPFGLASDPMGAPEGPAGLPPEVDLEDAPSAFGDEPLTFDAEPLALAAGSADPAPAPPPHGGAGEARPSGPEGPHRRPDRAGPDGDRARRAASKPAERRRSAGAGSGTRWLLPVLILVLLGIVAAAWFGLVEVPLLAPLLPDRDVPDAVPVAAAPAVAAAPRLPPERALPVLGASLAIGSYAEPAVARLQAGALAEQRPDLLFVVAPVRVNGTTFHRLLAGPAVDSAGTAAVREALASVLTQEDPGSWVVRPTPLAFQMGGVVDEEAARRRADAMSSLDIPAYVLELPSPDGTARYGVFAGAYADAEEASYLGELLDREGVTDARLTARTGRHPE